MMDDEIFILMRMNTERTFSEQSKIQEEFWKMDDFLHKNLKANAKHHIYTTEENCAEAMRIDMNPYSTFEVKK